MVYAHSHTVAAPGRYRVRAERLSGTDLLSVYVNRVRKLSEPITVDPPPEPVMVVLGELQLQTNDLVESTGTLQLEML